MTSVYQNAKDWLVMQLVLLHKSAPYLFSSELPDRFA